MSEIFIKCVSDHNGALIGLTADDDIKIADDFDTRLAALKQAGQNEAVAEALMMRRMYWLYEGHADSVGDLVAAAEPMRVEDVERIGKILFGEQWKAPLATALNVNERTILRIAARELPVPGWMDGELRALKEKKMKQLSGISR